MEFLQDKKILLCVSGGIAVYKSLELVRFFKKRGARVRVVMSEGAERFVGALSFEALSGEVVLKEGSESWSEGGANHISYASWADVCVIAPSTINTLCKFAYGIADNVMLSTLLASPSPKLIAPSANTTMYLSPQSQNALKRLQEIGVQIISPREDLLACGVKGVGAMAEVEEIGYEVARALKKNKFWSGKEVVISGGGSSEAIDEVRCISNHSSGLQASYLALVLYLLGANVTFVTSKIPIFLPSGIRIIKAQSTQEFYEKISMNVSEGGYYFGVGAMSDFKPKDSQKGKIKKSQGLELEFVPTIDILKTLQKEGLIKVGFKAEKDKQNAKSYATKMLEEKGCKYVCLNVLGEQNPFGSEQNAITLFYEGGSKEFALSNKLSLCFSLLEFIAND
ncbi:bifunctional phosphopantothenoylcysteine decarboxylase/phosphopantothenate--cysteine ligase CoaBC [Helicobacter brantae]|uniref:Coenzyme A biosynthesis bifunctional protein CoaBC n=1 Tax=Helicobacter brantae TaxID=375927 RepID=A0A3D8J4N2_9HELI|nr:bifunctional phosphopantothenoylcysteine decarboxylase/phosphopantothenate--cysteine ligase CoaBC [Helicobacter brantae]RDU72190.1 bifunctional phosphopantothenoylcysteine decarboxylase/phosphopantothenate--cysteine ligase CoaBC [Helicobacter brantae]